ncbi:MAG: SoxR reducing system RseC family protein [Bacteroidales bacterium]|nr:SoxR reducing system RseC family protein [Bacteroidales bacterium]MDD4361207.1 SoxR reducing system RseC family protein [Bacteroidales bacterium]MDD4431278.1 SoxR reducing system RseC family protein [Bacteroidales bacterium]
MDEIRHYGLVDSIDEKGLHVRIDQYSACGVCQAKKFCSSSEKQEKIIDILTYQGQYKVGDRVEILGSTAMGYKAVLWAYVIPLVITVMILVLSLTVLFPGKEALAALLALLSPIVYYLLLHIFRSGLKQEFSFKVRSLEENISIEL